MADILKGFAGGAFVFFLAWIFPCAALVGLVTVFVLPIWLQLGLPNFGATWDSATALLVVAFIAVFLGVLGSTGSTPLYRLIEGYAWPEPIQLWAIARRRQERDALRRLYEEVADIGGRRANVLYEQLSRYPVDDTQLAPTRLGNAIHVMELYGRDRFGLDSQTWWTELYSVSPAPIRQEVDNARAGVDFFVAALYASVTFGGVAVTTFLVEVARSQHRPWTLLTLGLLAAASGWLWYRTAIWGCGYWLSAVQAMVNLGRLPLAESLGLRLPDTFERERELWTAATDVVNSPSRTSATAALDPHRVRSQPPPASGGKARRRPPAV
jgi:hypothetical protein